MPLVTKPSGQIASGLRERKGRGMKNESDKRLELLGRSLMFKTCRHRIFYASLTTSEKTVVFFIMHSKKCSKQFYEK